MIDRECNRPPATGHWSLNYLASASLAFALFFLIFSSLLTRAGSNSSEELFCPRKWDGWDCWPETKAGTVIEQICPLMSLQSHFRDLPDCLKGYSFKSCQSDGNWFRLPDTQTEKTNYAYCSFVGRSKSLAEIYLRLVLHSISLVCISISVIIFIYFEQHKIVRIRIHLNLFASLAIYSISDIIFYTIIRWSHLTDISDNILKDKYVLTLCVSSCSFVFSINSH